MAIIFCDLAFSDRKETTKSTWNPKDPSICSVVPKYSGFKDREERGKDHQPEGAKYRHLLA